MLSSWDDRFSSEEYVYGKEPNVFFKEQFLKLKRGKILLPCEGEGRNAVFAAEQAWYTYAFDSSLEGQKKAMALAQEKFVQIQYDIQEMATANFEANSYDSVGLFFAHFPIEHQAEYYDKCSSWVKEGGHLILELFSKSQLPYQEQFNSGGPKNIDMLLNKELIRTYFPAMEVLLLEEGETLLNEGPLHNGLAHTVRFVGRKTNSQQQTDKD